MSPSGMDLLKAQVSNSNSAISNQRQLGDSQRNTLRPSGYPIGRRPFPAMRRCSLEAIAERVCCPHQGAGCEVALGARELEEHALECTFRDILCPLGVLKNCSWAGKPVQLMEHFKQKHPSNCNVFNESDVQVGSISEDRDMRYVYLIAQADMHFLITVKTDTVDKAVHISIQYIGEKKDAHRFIYEIYISSIHDKTSRVVFVERCFNDTVQADDIFRQGKCASIPFRKLQNYVKQEKLAFKFVIKKSHEEVATHQSSALNSIDK